MSTRWFALGGLLAAASPALAQTADAAQLPVVVTASRLALPLGSSIIGGQVLAGRESLADALAGIPQLFVPQPGGRSGFAAPFLAGAEPNFVVVLFDGVPLNNATSSRGGAVNLSEISSFGLETVEVAPGSLSAVQGSGALGGVIALKPAPLASTVSATIAGGGGTRGDWTGRGALNVPVGSGRALALSAVFDDDGEATPGAEFQALTLVGRIGDAGGTDRLLIRYNQIRSAGFPDNSGGPRLALLRETDRREAEEWIGSVRTRQQLGPAVGLDLSASWLSRHDTLASPGVAPPPGAGPEQPGLPATTDDSSYRRLLGQAALTLGGEPARLVLGIEGQHESGRAEGALDFGFFALPTAFALSRDTVAGFIEAGARHEGLSGTAALRVDRVSGLKARLTGRLAADVALAPGLVLAASAGSSFKAPSFYALANPLVGNPGLRPERARRASLELIWTNEAGYRVALHGFTAGYIDLIDFIADPRPQLINRTAVAIDGVGLNASLPLVSSLDATFGVERLWPRDTSGGPPLLARPGWRGNATLAWRPLPRLTLNARLGYTGARDDSSVPTGRVTLGAYTLAGFDAQLQLRSGFSLQLAIDNALDARFEDAVGFATPPLRARLLAQAQF